MKCFNILYAAKFDRHNFIRKVKKGDKQASFSVRPDFLYSLVYDNFFQRSNVGGRKKNKNKMSQNKDIT